MNKKIRILLAVLALWAASLACDNNPCVGDACGITSPHGEVLDNAIDFIEQTDPAGDSNNW